MRSKFSWSQKKRLVGLGPMDGISDSPFRILNKRFGADFVFTEMISANGLVRRSKNIFSKLKFKKVERPIIAQIFGKDPKIMAEAGEILEKEFKFDALDINCGCPMRKVIHSGHGGALLKNPKLLLSLLDIVRRKVKIPLSVKTRLGYSNSREILKLAPEIAKKGINCLIVHARTVQQKFSGETNWIIFDQLKSIINIPVIASGNIFSQKNLAELFANYEVNGAIIARGALGNPWIFEGLDIIKNNPQAFLQKNRNFCQKISLRERKEVILKHLKLMVDPSISGYQEEEACILFRKFFLWYLKKMPKSKKIKLKATKIVSLKQAKEILSQLKE